MSDDFQWHPDLPRRGTVRILPALVVGISALAGFAIGNQYPLSGLVDALERNGVSQAPDTAKRAALQRMIVLELPARTPNVAASVAPILVNPGTAGPDQIAKPQASELPRAPEMQAIVPLPLAKTDPPARAARKNATRNVLVVVRRVGPPYDTKVLRGRIHGGRLVVDQRDQRGIKIR